MFGNWEFREAFVESNLELDLNIQSDVTSSTANKFHDSSVLWVVGIEKGETKGIHLWYTFFIIIILIQMFTKSIRAT